MDSSYVEDALTDAQQAFEREPARKESGLDVDDVKSTTELSGYTTNVWLSNQRCSLSRDQ